MSVLTCPVCQGAMREFNREGILIDCCTQCKGVWLDRGELEKLMSLSRQDDHYEAAPARSAPPPYQERPPERHPQQGYGDHRPDYDARYGKRKKSKFEALFDIFD
jgi:Zn-finger nucleic acid-binding protein